MLPGEFFRSALAMSFPLALSTAGRRIRGLIGVLAAFATFGASAQEQWSKWDVDFDEDKKPWKEIEARIPSYPKPENLISFEAGKTGGHRYFIDAQSLSLGEDDVVRYVLVVKAAGGATNVTFEGIRCELRQQKFYAIGQANGNWTRARNPQWRQIGAQETSQHGTLLNEYFCADRSHPATPEQAIRRLKHSGSARYGGPTPE